MFRTTYGGSQNNNRQNDWLVKKREERATRCVPPPPSISTYGPLVEAEKPKKPKPHERDVEFWGLYTGETERKKLEEEMRIKKEKEEKARIEAERIANLTPPILTVKSIDLHINENTEAHHTDLYDCTEDEKDPQLVVRRGQEVKMTITFQRPYTNDQDDMEIVFKIGEEPNPSKKTYICIKLREDDNTDYMTAKKKDWGARIMKKAGNTLTIAVYIAPDAIIGEWEYTVRTIKEKNQEEFEYETSQDIIILLNPWCKDDQVFYKGDITDLNEYILNQAGACFFGSKKRLRSSAWAYGQFEEGVLDISLHLLRKSNNYTITAQMNDPVFIARALTRILNNNDDGGVLHGRWDGKYDDGVNPTTWRGSAAILKQYRETKKPVKYAQCWVFSAVLTTVTRALGLPGRSMTNYSSAHDTDLTMTVDKYYDAYSGDEIESKNSDNVWNFHVWNEVWINRPDLDKAFDTLEKYDGWHAIDATPQEMSDGMYQCGPAPVRAIKEGEVHVGYDTKFIFGEVNAECVDWKDGYPPSIMSRNSNKVGKCMSTKKPDGARFWSVDWSRLDVTNLYKYEEGSVAEREAVARATDRGKYGDILFHNEALVQVEILHDNDSDPVMGEDLTVKVEVTNRSYEKRDVLLRVNVRPTSYWGGYRGKEKIASKEFMVENLQPNKSQIYEIKILAKDYIRLCDDIITMRVLAIAHIKEYRNNPTFASEDIDVAKPALEISGPKKKVRCDEEFEVAVKLINPLKAQKLTGCEVHVEGNIVPLDALFKLRNAVHVANIPDLQAGETKELKIKVKPNQRPKKLKERQMEMEFTCKELPNFGGSLTVELE